MNQEPTTPPPAERSVFEPLTFEPPVSGAPVPELPVSAPSVTEPQVTAAEPPLTEPMPQASEPAPAGKPRARRLVGTVLPAVLVLAAIVGGLTYTKVTVEGADRTAPTTLWAEEDEDSEPAEDPAGDIGVGRADTELSKLLLPVPDNYRLGPDIAEYGNDDELSDKQATALLKTAGKGLTSKQRRERNKYLEKLRLKGVAMRSYTSGTNDLIVEMSIIRMENKKAVHDMYSFQTELFDGFGVFRDGPAIEGHKKAKCYLMPADKESKLDGMNCIAYDGELLVSMDAYGTEPFPKSSAAKLLQKQLDHIASPGEYV